MPSGIGIVVLRPNVVGIVRGDRLEGRIVDLFHGREVGQSRNTAFRGAGAERDQDLALPAQQFGHVLVLVVTNAAVEESQE